jgi:hypothetical protein
MRANSLTGSRTQSLSAASIVLTYISFGLLPQGRQYVPKRDGEGVGSWGPQTGHLVWDRGKLGPSSASSFLGRGRRTPFAGKGFPVGPC